MMRDGLMGYCDSKSIKFTSLFISLYDQFHHKNFKSIKISDIFEPFQDKDDSIIEPKYILIDGAPGMGKTTLCKEIAYQWANGELLIGTKIVFLLFLRDPAMQKIHDLKDFIHYF